MVNKLIIILITIIAISLMARYIHFCAEYDYIADSNSPYYGSWSTKERIEDIQIIDSFIMDNEKKNIKTIILSSEANLYMLPLQKNDREFDLPIQGNLGIQGEDGLIEKIQKQSNAKILIQTNEEDIFWQESKKARKYIEESYEKEGTIEDFDIYSIK